MGKPARRMSTPRPTGGEGTEREREKCTHTDKHTCAAISLENCTFFCRTETHGGVVSGRRASFSFAALVNSFCSAFHVACMQR